MSQEQLDRQALRAMMSAEQAKQALTVDSDNNDPNQPFTSNNQFPQSLLPPIKVSGILECSILLFLRRACIISLTTL